MSPIFVFCLIVLLSFQQSNSLTCECTAPRSPLDEITVDDLIRQGVAKDNTEALALVRDFQCRNGHCKMKDLQGVSFGRAKGMQSVCKIVQGRGETKKDCFYRWSKLEDKVDRQVCKQPHVNEKMRMCTADNCNRVVDCQV